jgi:hypothetical protein
MSHDPDRRHLLQLLALLPGAFPAATGAVLAMTASQESGGSGPEHDFDFFFGAWRVHHRRLSKRLADNDDWEEFEGSTRCESILGGLANFNDSVSTRSGRSYRGLGLRAYDAKSNTWADWWLDGSNPTRIHPPGIGRFAGNVGTFLSDETFEGRPVRVRGIFTAVSPGLAQWEQAFSPDEGRTWETNWVMRYTRTG